jgi:hypothetical protein
VSEVAKKCGWTESERSEEEGGEEDGLVCGWMRLECRFDCFGVGRVSSSE